MKILPNLDVLRFVLATLVLMDHVHLLSNTMGLPFYSDSPIFSKGMEAVYMFFTLSGFLIIRLIYLDKEKEHFSVRKFYIRRILRIFPLYYLIVLFGFLFYHLLLPQFNFPTDNDYKLTDGILLTTFFLPNVFTSSFEVGAIHQILWSIGIEEQFYIMIAPFSFFINKNWFLKALIILTGIYFLLFHFSGLEFLIKYKMVYFFLFFGGVISILAEKNKLTFLSKYKIIPILIVVCTFLYYTTHIFTFENLFLTNLFAATLLGLFIHTISCNNSNVIIKNEFVNYLGKISYGIYMYHVIAIFFVLFIFLKVEFLRELNDTIIILLINFFAIILTCIISHFSYKYFELRFLALKNKFRD